MRWRHCTGCASQNACRTVQHHGANFQSASRQRSTISGAFCRRRWPARSASSAVSRYQPPSRAAHQAVYCWQPCLSGCRSSSMERSVRGRRLIVIIADFPPSIKNSSFLTFIPSPDFLTVWLASLLWSLWYLVRYLGHSKNLCLLTYLHVTRTHMQSKSRKGDPVFGWIETSCKHCFLGLDELLC